nr:reverse transcriptase domain-containing protein [Tanacetum cinerariifolium]
MKKLIVELPKLIVPIEKEELIVYLVIAKEAVGAVLMTRIETKKMLIYFISRALQGLEINYSPMEKLVLAQVHASKRLKRYFQAHPIIVITDQPIKQVLLKPKITERMQKWSIELREYNIQYMPRTLVKGQILADFIVELSKDDSLVMTTKVEEELLDPWTLFTDGSSCVDGSGAGLILTKQMGVKNLQTNVDSHLVANQINRSYIAKDSGMVQYLEKVKALASSFKKFSIKQCFASIKHPQANGLVERENRSLREGIKARLDERSKDWIEEISRVLWAHRNMIKSSNEDTPFSLTYKTKAVILVEIDMPTLRTAKIDMVQNDEALEINLDLLEERKEQAAIRKARSKANMEKYYNSKVRNSSFKPGDHVYRNNDASHAKDSGKLRPKWEGLYEVTEALGNKAYKLRDRNRKLLPRTWNVRNLKKCYVHEM